MAWLASNHCCFGETMECFRNPFAIQVDPTMRGGKSISILATRSEMGRLAAELAAALRRCDDGSLPVLKVEA